MIAPLHPSRTSIGWIGTDALMLALEEMSHTHLTPQGPTLCTQQLKATQSRSASCAD